MGASVSLFCAVQTALEERFPCRALEPVKTNEIIRLLGQVEELYAALPVATEVFVDPPPPPEEKPCPFGKSPCHLNNGHCNVSPGLYIGDYEGRDRELEACGECVREIQGEGGNFKIKGQARSLGGD